MLAVPPIGWSSMDRWCPAPLAALRTPGWSCSRKAQCFGEEADL